MINSGRFIADEGTCATSNIVKANNHIFLSGQSGISLDGKSFVGENDIESQVENAMKNTKNKVRFITSRGERFNFLNGFF